MALLGTVLYLTACAGPSSSAGHNEHGHHGNEHGDDHHDEGHAALAQLTPQQFAALNMRIGSLPQRAMAGYVETNGQLILPPQSQAAVTAVMGANVHSVTVIEGYQVKKGQPLAYLYHPDLIALQTQYVASINELDFLAQEYKRQQALYNGAVGAGKELQATKTAYSTMQSKVKGLQAQLRMLHISPEKVQNGQVMEKVPVLAPMAGYVQSVSVRTGQYVAPATVMFELVQNDHIHAHFNVFEQDIAKVKEGQVVRFSVAANATEEREATIFAVGKVFEQGSKSINLHAELENEDGALLPGMYVRGRIVLNQSTTYALHKDAVVMEGNRYFVFTAQMAEAHHEEEHGHEQAHNDHHDQSHGHDEDKAHDHAAPGHEETKRVWQFTPVEVGIGKKDGDWIEIKPFAPVSPDTQFAWNNAYYLMAEMKKAEAGHQH